MVFPLDGDAIHAQELVAPLETTVAVGHAPGNDARNVDGRVLLLPSHDVESEALLRLGQLHDARVGVTLTRGKSSDRCLEKQKECTRFGTAWTLMRFINVGP